VWLRDLPPDQRVALTLKAVEGMSSGEVAGAMGVSEGAVEQLLVRARAALRKKRED
jgi:RNA polymerase sigma-70 factor (ECF subfamily)